MKSHTSFFPPLCDRSSLMMLSGPLDGVRVSMYMATYLSTFISQMQSLQNPCKSKTKQEFQGKLQMNEMWKIKPGEDQDLYKRCSMILVPASFIRNWVQPSQTMYSERLIHSFLCATAVSLSSTELLSIYFPTGKQTFIHPHGPKKGLSIHRTPGIRPHFAQ